MLSKNKIKSFRSLEMKKNRDANDVFVAEGPKVVHDILSIHKELLSAIAATEEWFAQENKLTDDLTCEKITVSADEQTKVSLLCHPQQVFAVLRKFKQITSAELPSPAAQLTLVLDGVQDPGNLGTIIRIADWFGITEIFCSNDTADAFNPKVVQATMGSIARVSIRYVNLSEMLSTLPDGFPVYGTFLDGEDIYQQTLSDEGLIIMGNEGNGISHEVGRQINRRLPIPNFSTSEDRAESLNVAIATAITCSEFRRKRK